MISEQRKRQQLLTACLVQRRYSTQCLLSMIGISHALQEPHEQLLHVGCLCAVVTCTVPAKPYKLQSSMGMQSVSTLAASMLFRYEVPAPSGAGKGRLPSAQSKQHHHHHHQQQQ
jgi:hypothetical protein